MNLQSADRKKLEILIVDDDKIVSLLHKNALKRNNITHEPIMCANGKKALDYLHTNQREETTFLVFLDLNMPVMNGWEFLKCTQKMTFAGKVFVVVISSSIYKADFINSHKYEQVIGFYRKPLNTEDLQDVKNLKEIKDLFKNNL